MKWMKPKNNQQPGIPAQPSQQHRLARWTALPLLLVLTTLLALCIPIRKTYSPELVATFPLETDYQQRYPAVFTHDHHGRPAQPVCLWFPVSENPYTEAGAESLREIIGEETPLDFDRYTYTISLGCTIQRIRKTTYLLTDVHNGYRYGEADAVLAQDCPGDQAFLYRIPKDWMDIKHYAAFDGDYRFAVGN